MVCWAKFSIADVYQISCLSLTNLDNHGNRGRLLVRIATIIAPPGVTATVDTCHDSEVHGVA